MLSLGTGLRLGARPKPGSVLATVANKVNYTVAPYNLYLSPWGADLKGYTAGNQYTQSAGVDPAAFPNNTVMNWAFPNETAFAQAPAAGVWGYDAISYGDYFGAPAPAWASVTATRLNTIQTLTASLSFSMSGQSANCLFEFFATKQPHVFETPGTAGQIEVGWFLRSPSETQTFQAGGVQQGNITDADGRVWSCALNGTYVTFMPTDFLDVSPKTLNVLPFVTFLIGKGILTGHEWFSGIALGGEPNLGAGSMTVNSFGVSYALNAFPTDPIQANYITSQNVGTFWSADNATLTATDVMETTGAAATHGTFKFPITRAAGIKNMRWFMDVEPIGGSDTLIFQAFEGTFGGAAFANAIFNLTTHALSFTSATGAWSAAAASVAALPGTAAYRFTLDWTTDATTTNLTLAVKLGRAGNAAAYVGDPTKGIKITKQWVYNTGAGAGGS